VSCVVDNDLGHVSKHLRVLPVIVSAMALEQVRVDLLWLSAKTRIQMDSESVSPLHWYWAVSWLYSSACRLIAVPEKTVESFYTRCKRTRENSGEIDISPAKSTACESDENVARNLLIFRAKNRLPSITQPLGEPPLPKRIRLLIKVSPINLNHG
jgi:hypothetical protein